MERDQLRETFFNGVLGRIARGVASLLAGLGGTYASDNSIRLNNGPYASDNRIPLNNGPYASDNRIPLNNGTYASDNRIPGPRNIKVNNGKGWTKKWDASEIKTKSVFKKNEIKTTTFDGHVMKTLWSKLFPDKYRHISNKWTRMRETLHSYCKIYMDSRVDLQTITREKVPSQRESVPYWEFLKLPFIIPPEDDRWNKNSIVKEPNPFVMYLFWHAIKISEKKDRKKKVRFTIDVDGTKYKFGDDDKNATEYYMKYDDQIHKK